MRKFKGKLRKKMKIEHKVKKSKSFVFMFLVICVFALAETGMLFLLNLVDNSNSPFKYLFYFLNLVVLLFIVTRADNNEMFQPMEFEEIEHEKVK